MNGFQPPQPPPLPQQPAQGPAGASEDIAANKSWAILAYLGILLLIPLLAKRDSPYVWYHVKQGIVLFVTAILWGVLASIISGAIPVILPYSLVIAALGLWGFTSLVVSIGLFVLWVMGVINAAKGEMKPLPIIGALAEKF